MEFVIYNHKFWDKDYSTPVLKDLSFKKVNIKGEEICLHFEDKIGRDVYVFHKALNMETYQLLLILKYLENISEPISLRVHQGSSNPRYTDIEVSKNGKLIYRKDFIPNYKEECQKRSKDVVNNLIKELNKRTSVNKSVKSSKSTSKSKATDSKPASFEDFEKDFYDND